MRQDVERLGELDESVTGDFRAFELGQLAVGNLSQATILGAAHPAVELYAIAVDDGNEQRVVALGEPARTFQFFFALLGPGAGGLPPIEGLSFAADDDAVA